MVSNAQNPILYCHIRFSINNEEDFHTTHARSTTKGSSCRDDDCTITQSRTRFCDMKCKCFCGTNKAAKKARRLYMIWNITGMCSFHNLSDLGLEKSRWVLLKPTKIFKDGSASARRPAVTQPAAPPDPIVRTATQIEKNSKALYLLRR